MPADPRRDEASANRRPVPDPDSEDEAPVLNPTRGPRDLEEPRGTHGLGRGLEPLSELQPANADLHQNPENVHPPLPPQRAHHTARRGASAAPAEDRADGDGDGDGANANANANANGDRGDEANSDRAAGSDDDADNDAQREEDEALSNKAFQFVFEQAKADAAAEQGANQTADSSGAANDEFGGGHTFDADPNDVVDEYLEKKRRLQRLRSAHEVGIVDDDIYNEDGGYDTDDAERIEGLLEDDYESRQEKELKKLLRIADRREKLKQKQMKSSRYRGMLKHPYNMEAVRRRLNGYSGVEALKSSHQRERFRQFRTLRPQQNFKYDKDGNLVRQSRMTYSNGVVYEGDLFNGKWHGRGVMTDSAGSRHVGEFRYGEKHGFGVCEYGLLAVPDPDGERGSIKVIRGEKYEGQFVNGKKCGPGKQWCGNESGEPPFDIYVGEFKNDYFHGEGTMHKANGEVYVGSWAKGLRHGSCCTMRVVNDSLSLLARHHHRHHHRHRHRHAITIVIIATITIHDWPTCVVRSFLCRLWRDHKPGW